MQVTALLVAVLLIGSVAAQGQGYDVTARQCLGANCNQDCTGYTFPGGVCHQSRRNSSQYEALFCNVAGVCMDLEIYMGANCNGQAVSSRRISNQCDGADACPFRWSAFNYLGNNKLQINFNCTSDCVSNCQHAGIVDITTCWNLGRISGTVENIGACRWINADQFSGLCSPKTVIVRNSVEEGVCFTEFNGLFSSTYQCEGAPPMKGLKVIKTTKKL